ncbi:MAG: RidA family protein [Kiloniellales bacterium]|nr:RidA family protein [Kiloniellales bacterium]
MSQLHFHMVGTAPFPVAPYSHAAEAGGWVFVTGQLPIDAAAPEAPLPAGIEAQTRKTMENLREVLASLGLGFEHVAMARVFLTHFEADYEAMNRVYAEYFEETRRPARTCVGVTALARDARVEIDLVVWRG